MIEYVVGAISTAISMIIGAAIAVTSKSFYKEEMAKRDDKSKTLSSKTGAR